MPLRNMLSSWQTAFLISGGYLFFVKVLGPLVMSKRRPFTLRMPIMVYNITQIVMNGHMLYLCFSLMGIRLLDLWSNVCNPVTAINNNPGVDLKINFILMYFYGNKIFDLLDTVFYVLRKKDSQITFLHVFHHTTIIFVAWLTAFPLREEAAIQLIWINVFVHVVMYTYYLLASFGPSVQKFLWWKRYVTTLQLVQFLTGMTVLVKMKLEECRVQQEFIALWFIIVFFIKILFINFYYQTYLKNKQK